MLIHSSAHQRTLLRINIYTSIYMGRDIHLYTTMPAAMTDPRTGNEGHRPTAGDSVKGPLGIEEQVARRGPTVGGIFWTGEPKSLVRGIDKIRLNCADSPNNNRKRRPWIIVEELPGGKVRVMYISSNPGEPIYPQGVLLRVVGLRQLKGIGAGRRFRRNTRSSSSRFSQLFRTVGRC